MPSKIWYNKIHERLLNGDPTASAELAESVLSQLLRKLEIKYPAQKQNNLLIDAVTDALMSYIKKPEQFDPRKRSLLGFLTMAAEMDLRNILAKLQRRKIKEISIEDVELQSSIRNNKVEEEDPVRVLEAQRIKETINGLFNDPIDLQIAELIIERERSTEAFSKIIGIENLSIDEQRREVKRHKDRIKKRLRRYGKKIQT